MPPVKLRRKIFVLRRMTLFKLGERLPTSPKVVLRLLQGQGGSRSFFLGPTFGEIVVRRVPEDVSHQKRRCENTKHRKVRNAWLLTSSAPLTPSLCSAK